MKQQSCVSLLVLAALLQLALPQYGWTQFNFITNDDNTITITGYTGSGGEVTIPSATNGWPVTAIGVRAFYDRIKLTGVTIPDSVTNIGTNAFAYCSKMTNVAIGSSVTSIGVGAFVECGLATVTIPNSVTTIGISAFFGCFNLTNVTIPASVTNIGSYAFAYCNGLHQAYFQGNAPTVDGEMGSVNNSVFSQDYGRVYYLPGTTGWAGFFGGWRTVIFTGPYSDFNYETNNGAITITGYNGWGGNVVIPGAINGFPVTRIGSSAFFSVQTTLTGLTIPNTVTNIGYDVFQGCFSLTSIDVNPGNASYASRGGVLFNKTLTILIQCPEGLTGSYTIPESTTNIDDGAFRSCASLTNIDVIEDNPSYASVGGVLFDKKLATLIQCPEGLTGSYAIPSGVITIQSGAFAACVNLLSVTIPNSVTTIGDRAFASCFRLTSVTIPESVTDLGSQTFEYCSGLHHAYFQGNAPNVDGAAGSVDSSVFYGETGVAYYVPGATGWGATFGGWPTTALTNSAADFTYTTNNGAITITGYVGVRNDVAIPGAINGHTVTSIEGFALSLQTTLTSVAIPDSVTNIGIYAFGGCPYLTTVTIGNSVTSIGDAAFEGSGLTSVMIPSSVTTFGKGVFLDCADLTNVAVNSSNTNYVSVGGVLFNKTLTDLIECPGGFAGSYSIPQSVTNIDYEAFGFCAGLTNVTIPDSVITISDLAFDFCSGLPNVTVPDSVTSIGIDTFASCSSLANVTIGNGVTSIGGEAFYSCIHLTGVTIPNSVTNISEVAFSACTALHQVFFQGNVPTVDGKDGSADNAVFVGEMGAAYYLPWTMGWSDTFGGWPTAVWRPQLQATGNPGAVNSSGYGFSINWAGDQTVVVEASTNLLEWTPVVTNTLIAGTNAFEDSDWTNYRQRFYRVRSN